MKREFLQLAHKYERAKHRIAGWYMSEKLDGLRCFWDGGITRGYKASEIPWANTEKHARFLVPPPATGLWSRYGQPIQAPAWFLDALPKGITLDGELYAGRGQFQLTSSIVRTMKNTLCEDARWKQIKLHVFDMPPLVDVLADGVINNTNFKKTFKGCFDFAMRLMNKYGYPILSKYPFQTSVKLMNKLQIGWNRDVVVVEPQLELPYTTDLAHQALDLFLEQVIYAGGEGVILRSSMHPWTPARVHHVLKVKPYHDDEAIVKGFTWGRRTDLGSKLLGKMGALVVDYKGKRLELSGFTDEEREIIGLGDIQAESQRMEGKENENWEMYPKHFKPGDIITFRYRELTNDGIPKEARYFRKLET